MKQFFVLLAGFLVMSSCNPAKKNESKYMKKVDEYATVKLTADISDLNENQREMLRLFIEAAQIMDEIFWMQAYGNKYELLDTITDPALKKFVEINYGPWERLDGNTPFIEGVQAKPAGANFYPS